MSLSLARCFAVKSNDGYFGEGYQPETLNESDDEVTVTLRGNCLGQVMGDRDVTFNIFDSANESEASTDEQVEKKSQFSLLTPSMRPSDMVHTSTPPTESDKVHSLHSNVDALVSFDEYGFVIDATSAHKCKKDDSLISDSFTLKTCEKESALRTKWISFLEINYNKDVKARMRWSDVEAEFTHSSALDDLIMYGVPNSMRSQLWLRFSKGIRLACTSSSSYAEMVDATNSPDSLSLDKQITGILGHNICFMTPDSVGTQRLIRILRVLTHINRSPCYLSPLINTNSSSSTNECINVPLIVAHLLLICEEEEAFWLTQSIILEMKNVNHQSILKNTIEQACPLFYDLLKTHDIDLSLIATHWFASLFASFITDCKLLFRLWDFYFYHGPIVLLHLTVGLIIKRNNEWKNYQHDSAELFNRIEDLPLSLIDNQFNLLNILQEGKEITMPLGSLIAPAASSFPDEACSSGSSSRKQSKCDIRKKNVLQTSLLIDLHEAIEAIAHHFEACDSTFQANLTIDLNEITCNRGESDEIFTKSQSTKCNGNQQQHRLARALVDFQRSESDEFELGFKKNDIITVLSEKDDDCWIGQLNDKQGWFPAKLVQVLQENCKYSPAGDEQVNSFITQLIRGRLCSTLKCILLHGLKQSLIFTNHPWSIITAITKATVESDCNSVYSKFFLTKSFRLDDLSRVLTPSEILYRSILQIDSTHKDEPFDIRFRSLICSALNDKMLHLYWYILCKSQAHLLPTYYEDWSFVTSPVWRLICAELRLLEQFTFHLDIDAEIKCKTLSVTDTSGSPVSKDGVQDMLVKHHLFSWDI